MTTSEMPNQSPPPYALQIPALWTSVDFMSGDFIDQISAVAGTAIPDIDVTRLTDQLRVAQNLALSLGITKCHALVREVEETMLILTLTCAIVRVVPQTTENNMDVMMRAFQTADGVDFEVLPMMSILTGAMGEILRGERIIPASTDRSLWANRMITYGIMHPSRESMAMLVGTSPNVYLPHIGDEFDAVAKSFFWIG